MNLYEFPIPATLNGKQLKTELGCESVYVADNKLIIGGDLTEAQAKAGIDIHIPALPIPPTPAEKLFAATGLTVAEYKALGL